MIEATNKEAALQAAVKQIQDHFRKPPVMRVWTDRYTEEQAFRYIKNQVECYFQDDERGSPFHDSFWESIEDDLEAGVLRDLRHHPFDRMYPPVSLGEYIGLAIRRFMEWAQHGLAGLKETCRSLTPDRAHKRISVRPFADNDDPPF